MSFQTLKHQVSLFSSNLNTTPICALWFFREDVRGTRIVRGWYILLHYIHYRRRFLKAYLRLMNVCYTTEKIRVNWNSFQRNEKYFHMLEGDLWRLYLCNRNHSSLNLLCLLNYTIQYHLLLNLTFYRRYSCWFQIISFTLSII